MLTRLGKNGSRRPLSQNKIDRNENILIGTNEICRYLRIKSMTTMIQWHEVYGLPIMKRPDGMWMSSCTAIDEWIFMASRAEAENRGYSRGTNTRADIALKYAQERVARGRKRGENG